MRPLHYKTIRILTSTYHRRELSSTSLHTSPLMVAQMTMLTAILPPSRSPSAILRTLSGTLTRTSSSPRTTRLSTKRGTIGSHHHLYQEELLEAHCTCTHVKPLQYDLLQHHSQHSELLENKNIHIHCLRIAQSQNPAGSSASQCLQSRFGCSIFWLQYNRRCRSEFGRSFYLGMC